MVRDMGLDTIFYMCIASFPCTIYSSIMFLAPLSKIRWQNAKYFCTTWSEKNKRNKSKKHRLTFLLRGTEGFYRSYVTLYHLYKESYLAHGKHDTSQFATWKLTFFMLCDRHFSLYLRAYWTDCLTVLWLQAFNL